MAGENDENTELTREQQLEKELEEHKQALAAERQRANTAQQRLSESEKSRQAAEGNVQDTQIGQVKTAIESLDGQLTGLEEKIETASAEGNHRLVASLTRQIGDLSARKLHLENGMAAMEAAKANPPPQQRQAPATGAGGADDPAEVAAQQVAAQGYHRSARWLRANPQFPRDPKLWFALITANNSFILKYGEDRVDTDDYFKYIEENEFVAPHLTGRRATNGSGARAETNDNRTDDGAATSGAAKGSERKGAEDRPAPAAPVARTNGSNRGARLTKEEQDMARATGQTDEEYAANRDKLVADGRMGPKARLN